MTDELSLAVHQVVALDCHELQRRVEVPDALLLAVKLALDVTIGLPGSQLLPLNSLRFNLETVQLRLQIPQLCLLLE